MAILAAVAVGLTVFVAPRTNRIYYDEQIYQSIGQNLADLKLAQMCNDGTVEYGRLQCWSGEYNKQPYAYPHLLSLAYRIVWCRASDRVCPERGSDGADGLLRVSAGVHPVRRSRGRVLCRAARRAHARADRVVGDGGRRALGLAGVRSPRLLGAAHAVRSRSTVALAGAAVAAAYAVQFRPESLLILPVVGLLLWQRVRDELDTSEAVVGGAAVPGARCRPRRLTCSRSGMMEWGTSEARLSLRYVVDNLRVNGRFYLGDERFPLVFTLLAIIGLPGRRFRTERAGGRAVLSAVLRDLSPVLCGKLQLRR